MPRNAQRRQLDGSTPGHARMNLAPEDVHWLSYGDTRVLGLHCKSPHMPPFQFAVAVLQWSQLVRSKDEVEWCDDLNPHLEAFVRSDSELRNKSYWSVKARGRAAFGIGRTRLACERAAYLALALTACLEENDIGQDVEPMLDAVRWRMEPESEPCTPLRSLQPKRRARPPFHALSDWVAPKARPAAPVITIEEERSRSPREEIPYQARPRLSQEQVRFAVFCQAGADWDPSRREWDQEKWASKLRRCDVQSLLAGHSSISMRFRSGPHAGQPVTKLIQELQSGKVASDEITALVGLEDTAGQIWVLCGNRRLYAYKKYAEHARKQVVAYVVVFKATESQTFPGSLTAKIYEAMSGDGFLPTLRYPRRNR